MSKKQYEFDLVCIGSGPAGQKAAVRAAKAGKRAAVIEKNRTCGGVCVDTGTIPSKTFREAVVYFTGIANLGERDRGHAARPTAEQLLRRVSEVVEREIDVIENQLGRNGVDLIRGRARFQDPHTIEVDEGEESIRTITSANVLIAVGTTPAPPPGVAPDGETIITSDGVVQLEKLPRNVAVVGGGVIGIEYASMFAALGIEVTLVERRPRPLEFMDFEIVDELIHQMRNRRVTFRFGEAVASISVSTDVQKRAILELESGKRIVSDLVLFSVGRVGATASLNLEAVGLEADDRGRIKVDDQFRTQVPHIFAAGDVIGYPSLAATSAEQGRLAACHAFDLCVEPGFENFPIGIYAIPELSMVGSTEQQLTEERVPYETGIARYREIARGQIMGDDTGMFKMLFHREDRKLLGVHVIGTGATELIHIGQAVIGFGGGLDYFLRTVFNYPTLAECYKVAALNAANKLAV